MHHDELRDQAASNSPMPTESDPLWQALDDWRVSEPGPKFDSDVMVRIRQEKATEQTECTPTASWLEGWRWLVTGRALAFSGTLATVLLVATVLRQRPDAPASPDTETAMEVSAQQVEWALEDLEMLEELYGLGESQGNAL